MIKRTAEEIFDTTQGFSEDFDRNKKLLKNTMPFKSVRNKVAGCIVGLAKKKRLKEHGLRTKKERTDKREDY